MLAQPQDRTYIGEASFSVAARVAMQLGRESISNSTVAIIELVKNAYDADANQVSIRFHGLDRDNPIMVITDDGIGMSEQAMRDQWLVVGTANKRTKHSSEGKHRVLVGEKGLGRLGLDRLCGRTTVRTFTSAEDHGMEFVIDWRKYENTQQRLEEIKHPLYLIGKTIVDPVTLVERYIDRGTWIVLEELKDQWNEETLEEVRRELTLLVSPFGSGDDFEISLFSGMDWRQLDGVISPSDMLIAAEWQLVAEIGEDGSVAYRMFSSHYEKQYELSRTPWEHRFKKTKSALPRCGPLRFEMYFYPRKTVELGDIRFVKRQITDFLELQQGIRIYRDGFRVKPYGEPDGKGDWLTISYRRQQSPGGVTQKGWRVGYNQVVGAVFISREQNPKLVDQTNREGLVEGPAFNDLVMFTSDAISFFERNRHEFETSKPETRSVEGVRQIAEEKANVSLEAAKGLQEATRTVDEVLEQAERTGDTAKLRDARALLGSAATEVNKVVTEAHEAQQRLVEVSRDQEEDFQRQKDTLANLASLGILAAGFGHETLGSANVVLLNAKQLDRNLRGGMFMVAPDVREAVEQNLIVLAKETRNIKDFAEFTLQTVRRDKRERKAVVLDQIVRDVFGYFQHSLDEKHIRVILDLPDSGTRPILAFEIDWESILLNLITNSIWAMEDTSAAARAIRVSLRESGDLLELRFADSGCGVAAGTEQDIFLPAFSTKRGVDGRVVGTGMGLAIIKSFVEQYKNGTISVIANSDLGGAEFMIRVPIPELASRGNKAGS